MALEMLVCPQCGQRVLVGSTGLCPSCRQEIRPPSEPSPAQPPSVAAKEPAAERTRAQRPATAAAAPSVAEAVAEQKQPEQKQPEQKQPEPAPPTGAELPPWAVGRDQVAAAPKVVATREYRFQLFLASAALAAVCLLGLVWDAGAILESWSSPLPIGGISKFFTMLAYVVALVQLVIGMVGSLAVLFRKGPRIASTAMVVLLAPPALFFVLPIPFAVWLLYLLQNPSVRAQFDQR